MQQVLDHRYITDSQDTYSTGYSAWSATEITKLNNVIKQEEEALSQVSDEDKKAFLKMSEESKVFYLS